MKTPEDCLFRIWRPLDGLRWNALACIPVFVADNKPHSKQLLSMQERSGEYSPGIINPFFIITGS